MLLAKIVLVFWCLFWAILNFKGSDSFNLDNVVYVSRAHGQSKDDCGSKAQPCKALKVGIDKLAWGGLLYIDGDQTTTDPYSCESSAGRVVAKKSFHVQSYNSMAEISCPNGFTISADNGSIGLDVTIKGVLFENTVLFLRNVPRVVIQDCTFLESSPAIDVIATYDSPFYSLAITRTLFKRNRGCIFFQDRIDSKKGRFKTTTLKLTNVTLEENIASEQSEVKPGLIFINFIKSDYNPSFQSTWENVIATRNSIDNTTMDTSKSSFRRKFYLRDPILNSIFVVYNCYSASLTFNQITSDLNSGLRFLGLRSFLSSLRIYKSYFRGHSVSGPGGVVYILRLTVVDVGIKESVFSKTFASPGSVIDIGEEKGFRMIKCLRAKLHIEKSTFLNNRGSINLEISLPYSVNIQVLDTVIKENTLGYQVFFVFGNFLVQPFGPFKIDVQVRFERVQFNSNSNNQGNELFLIKTPQYHDGRVSLVLFQCVFTDNFLNSSPNNSKDLYEGKSLFLLADWASNRAILTFNETIFENNTVPYYIVYIPDNKASFTKCLFKNNYSLGRKTAANLYIGTRSRNVGLDNTTFVQTQNYVKQNYGKGNSVRSMLFMFSAANGKLTIKKSKFVSDVSSERVIELLIIQTEGPVHMENTTELLCPVGSRMELEDNSINTVSMTHGIVDITRKRYFCKICGLGKYSLERGSYKGRLNSIECIEFCPFGAECTWNIQSRPNFWGYYTSTDPPQLNFTICHEKYCHVPKSSYTNTSVYNACYGNRTGIMCGACKEGFTESMFNHKCRPNEECRDVWFWVIAGLYSIIMACYFLYRPAVLLYLVKNLLWFRKKKPSTRNGTLDEEEESNEHGGHGYSKIIFYFYQVAELLMLESASEILHSYNLISSVLSFYSFQIELADSKLGCPFPGLTAVTKELFRSAQVFAVMGFILVFYFLHWLLRLFRIKSRPDLAPYLAAIVEVLLLGYERLGHTSLILLNCVPIKVRGVVEWRLVLDGTVACWSHWWQYCLIAYNVIFVLPFLLVLLMGTSRLRSQRITAVQFVAACFVPLPFVAYWLITMCFTRRESDETHDITTAGVIPDNPGSEALLEVLQGPFRPPDHQSRGASYWESILIGRRLIFLCLYSFVSTPMLRMLFMTTVCFTMPFHNVIINPYKDRRTNAFGIIMLFIHVVLAIINLCKSVFITIGVTAEGPTRSQIDGLQLFEVALLGFLPCVFGILVVATLVSQVFRLLVLILRMIRRCIMYIKRRSRIDSCDDVHRTLTSPTEEDSILYEDIIG